MRLHAVSSLISRKDTIVVASISCIYGIGDPGDFRNMSVDLREGASISRQNLLRSLVEIQYERNDKVLEPGRFRVRGDTVDVIPAYEDNIVRTEIENGRIKSIKEVNLLTGDTVGRIGETVVYPARQYVVPPEKQQAALERIKAELATRFRSSRRSRPRGSRRGSSTTSR